MLNKVPLRDLISFWIFGFANNYAYVIMLSAAVDIISKQDDTITNKMDNINANLTCQEKITERKCSEMSTGAVLIADILPCLIIKILAPLFMHRLPFGLRHLMVCLLQAFSFVIVSYSPRISVSLFGIALASIGSGFGESCYLALAAHYPKTTISLWSSGTGGAGVAGTFAYALLTEPQLFGLLPRQALISMLIIPAVFAITYWFILTRPPSVYQAKIFNPRTWIVPKEKLLINKEKYLNSCDITINQSNDSNLNVDVRNIKHYSKNEKFNINKSQIYWILPILRYMIPLSIVYFAEYLINQGVVELFVFDCAHGFNLPQASQYRWYQALYQMGVFISRSSVNFFELSAFALYMLPILQTINLVVFFFNAIYSFIPHIALIFAFILFEGFFGGASYVNTFNRIYKETPSEAREFCLSIATLSDSVGTVLAGFAAFPLHKHICSLVVSRNCTSQYAIFF